MEGEAEPEDLFFSSAEWLEPSASPFFAKRPPVPLALLKACWWRDSCRYGCRKIETPHEGCNTLRYQQQRITTRLGTKKTVEPGEVQPRILTKHQDNLKVI